MPRARRRERDCGQRPTCSASVPSCKHLEFACLREGWARVLVQPHVSARSGDVCAREACRSCWAQVASVAGHVRAGTRIALQSVRTYACQHL
eukprot:996199-Alexandrium_andersonii.AAC.1